MTTYGKELLGERSKRRVSQADLSNLTGVFVQTIVDIENDRLGIDEETYDRFIAALRTQDNINPTEVPA